MTSLYEVLKRSKTAPQLAPDMFTALWAKSIAAGKIIELSGQVPLSFKANGKSLLDYLISGNMEQSGTPTPDSPIMPEGCGDLETVGAKAGQYKIPILSNSTTTPVYLGEVETTRKVKKLVLTGEENGWSSNGSGNSKFFYVDIPYEAAVRDTYCTHFQYAAISSTNTNVGQMAVNGVGQNVRFRPENVSSTTLDNFKTYLQQQYAAGTPVTVWYVLASETTGIVNEPLMRIGDYADTVSCEQAGVQIPTNKGSTTLDVLTSVKPSNVSIKYRV